MKVLQAIGLVALGWTTACGGTQRQSQTPRANPAAGEHGIEGETNTAPLAEEVTANDATDTPQDLTSATQAFDTALDAAELSCTGAKGYVDAICRIAERICDVSTRPPPSSAPPRDCDDARSECERSQERYAERCSE